MQLFFVMVKALHVILGSGWGCALVSSTNFLSYFRGRYWGFQFSDGTQSSLRYLLHPPHSNVQQCAAESAPVLSREVIHWSEALESQLKGTPNTFLDWEL